MRPPKPPHRQSSPAEIERLDAVCARLAGFDGRVSTEWVDGWFAALVAGPRAVSPAEWLPAMFGDAFARTFADPQDVQQALDALMARHNVVALQLHPDALAAEPDALRLQPLMLDWEGGDDERDETPPPRTGEEWARGVLDAVEHLADDWRAPAPGAADAAWYAEKLRDVEALVLDAAALERHVAATYRGNRPSRDELIDVACHAIQDLRMYWIDHAPRHAPVRVAPTPGRNDPCPCGSGRKYKKCHGAAA